MSYWYFEALINRVGRASTSFDQNLAPAKWVLSIALLLTWEYTNNLTTEQRPSFLSLPRLDLRKFFKDLSLEAKWEWVFFPLILMSRYNQKSADGW